MQTQDGFDYRELAYDLYHSGDELLDKLVAMRKRRGMTQAQLANEMGVTQGYISQIENGKTNMVSLLTDYALEVGARIEYQVEPAEVKPEGSRHYLRKRVSTNVDIAAEWKNDDNTVYTFAALPAELSVDMPRSSEDGILVSFTVMTKNNTAATIHKEGKDVSA